MKITRLEPFILHVPVTREEIGDSTHRITHWGMPGVRVHTDEGLVGFGHTGTHAHLPSDRVIVDLIENTFGPQLIGRDPGEPAALYDELYRGSINVWIGRGGLMQMALSAIDTALWDLKAKAEGVPLWQLLGGSADKNIEAYNTDGGWLNRPIDMLADDCRKLVHEDGFDAVKIKVGHDDPPIDIERVAAVREAIGPNARLMIDANGKWDLPTASDFAKQVSRHDLTWFEEPLWHDDIAGHAELAKRIDIPIALGELLYHDDQFKTFIDTGGVHYVQPDIVRIGGVTGWTKVADYAHAKGLPVSPHHGDMMQAQIHLTIAHPGCVQLEFIPWTLHCFEEPADVEGGVYKTPQQPGAGTTFTQEALRKYNAMD